MKRFELATLFTTEPTTRDRIGEPYLMRSGKHREITSTWIVGPGNTKPDANHGEEGTIVVDLGTFHHADRKEFSSTLRVSIESADGRMKQTTISYGLKGEACDVYRATCERFSAKAMRAHHARALYLVMECSADHTGMALEPGVAQYRPKVTA